MRRMLYIVAAVVGLLSLVPPTATEACGGLFCTNTPVDQSAERIIFAVDRAKGEITAYVQINYTGDSDSFSWVVPVPNNPKVDVADITAFNELSQLTAPRMIFPPPPDCFPMPMMDAAGAMPEGVNVMQQGSVGPYDYAVIDGDAAEMVSWLRDNGYRITPEMEPLVQVYTDEGMAFLAMKLSGGKGVQDIQPVVMTYKSSAPMIPIRLTAVAANPNMAIVTWIFADEQATPANMTRLKMVPNDIAETDMFGSSNYNDLRSGAIDSVKGQGFVVEYAQPTSELASSDPLVKQLIARYPYVTRLYGEMSPEEMTVDPQFSFDPQLAPVSNVFDFSKRVTPYDCESQRMHTVRRQQFDAAAGNRSTPEQATQDLRRGPLQLLTGVIVVALLGLIFWLGLRRPRQKTP